VTVPSISTPISDRYQRAAEPLRRRSDEDDEQDQEQKLSDLEGSFGAGGGEGMESRDVLEELRDQDEDVEILGDHGGDGVGAAPASTEVAGVEGEQGDGEDEEREDAEHDAWSDLAVGEAEAGDACKDRHDQKEAVPQTGKPAPEQAEEKDESRCDTDEADDDVHGRVGCKAHVENHGEFPLFIWNRNFLLHDAVIKMSE
jgi:hypothetical protein